MPFRGKLIADYITSHHILMKLYVKYLDSEIYLEVTNSHQQSKFGYLNSAKTITLHTVNNTLTFRKVFIAMLDYCYKCDTISL